MEPMVAKTSKWNRLITLLVFLTLVIITNLSMNAMAWEGLFPSYEAYVHYTHNYPYALESDWSDNFQGITHDKDHWYLTQERVLFRIPVTLNLNQNIKGKTGESHIWMPDIPELWEAGFDHFGDATFYDPDSSDSHPGYVLVAVTGHIDPYGLFPVAALAAFRADETLDLIDFIRWPEEGGQGSQGGWVAVSPSGKVYSSRNHANMIYIYELDWQRLGTSKELSLTNPRTMPLLDLNGELYTLDSMQGGVISATGQVMFLTAGLNCDSQVRGLFAFEVPTGRLLATSCQDGCFFRFQFTCGDLGDEPEGLTIWDLDDGRAPGMSGQLHVAMIDNDVDTDQVYIKHYTMRRYLEPGDDIQAEYNTVFDHAELNLAPGSYELSKLRLGGKVVKLVAPKGKVFIGRP